MTRATQILRQGGGYVPARAANLFARLAFFEDRRSLALLQRARAEAPGETQTIAGVACMELSLAGRKVCLWEEAGLPLRYEGPSFSLVATKVDRDTAIDDAQFKLPPEARPAREVPLPTWLEIDGKAAMDALVEGDLGPIAVLLTPGFRVPESWGVGDEGPK